MTKTFDLKEALRQINAQPDKQLKMQQVQACNGDLMKELTEGVITMERIDAFKDVMERFAFGVNSQMEDIVIDMSLMDSMLQNLFPELLNRPPIVTIPPSEKPKNSLILSKEEILEIIFNHAKESKKYGDTPIVMSTVDNKFEILW